LSHWKNQIDTPCFPGNLGYWFLKECNANSNTGILDQFQKVVQSTFTALLYLFTTATVFLEYEIIMLHSYCIMNYLRLFEHKLNNTLARVSELHIDTKLEKLLLMYREIELLVGFFNWFHGGTLIVSYALDCAAACIISSYVILRLYNELPGVLLFNCGLLVLDTFLALKDFDAYKSGVFQVSKALISKVKVSLRYLRNKKRLRRYVKSWRGLRIYMGSTNYYDELTPLNIGSFNVQQIVSLLLL